MTQMLGSALSLSTPGWPGMSHTQALLPEVKARWLEAGRKLLPSQLCAQDQTPITKAEPQDHQPVTQQSSDSRPNPHSRQFRLVFFFFLSFLRQF